MNKRKNFKMIKCNQTLIRNAKIQLIKDNNESTTMAISNWLFSAISENPRGFSVWCILAKLTAKPRNYS